MIGKHELIQINDMPLYIEIHHKRLIRDGSSLASKYRIRLYNARTN